jgi:AcrR family transcriptional regulator
VTMTTREKIIHASIALFNRDGFGKVSLQAIADKASISQGNLTYHFRTKQALMLSILTHITEIKKVNNERVLQLFGELDIMSIMKAYLQILQDFRFFYRDIYEISAIAPEALDLYKQQIDQFMTFGQNSLYMAIGKGLIHPEPHPGHYAYFAKNSWAVMHSWVTQREILGSEQVPITDALNAMLELHYFNLTEKGREIYEIGKAQIGELVNA